MSTKVGDGAMDSTAEAAAGTSGGTVMTPITVFLAWLTVDLHCPRYESNTTWGNIIYELAGPRFYRGEFCYSCIKCDSPYVSASSLTQFLLTRPA